MDTNTLPLVSVVVPVYNDRERLERCLTALERQTYLPDRYEVIAVDNGSRESIADRVERLPHARPAVDERPGSYAARNTGINLARGEVLAFTDADCIPATDWLMREVRQLCADSENGLVDGRIRLTFRDPDNLTTAEIYERIFAFRQKRNIQRSSFGSTSNVFTHRRVINAVGPFNVALKSTGDSKWGQRVAAAGYRPVYTEDAVVDHAARRSVAALISRRRRIVEGRFDLSRQLQQTVFHQPPKAAAWGVRLLEELRQVLRDSELRPPSARESDRRGAVAALGRPVRNNPVTTGRRIAT